MSDIPISFIKKRKEIIEKALEYTVMYDEDDREEWIKLSAKVNALDELIRDWKRHESKNI